MNTSASILVIDDEPDNFDVIDTLLHDLNYQLHYAPTGRSALDLLDTFQPDVILLDVMMPDMNGIEVCQRLKSSPQWQPVPIIIVTALTAKDDLAKCFAAGANDFISKPVNSTELRARVDSMLRIKQQHDEMQALLRLREDMVNMVVHDLRNPLSTIVLATELLKYPNLPVDKQRHKVEQIASASQELRSLIDGLLLMAKLEAGKLTPNPTELDLHELCQAAISGLEAIATQKHLQLVSRLPAPGCLIYADAALLRRIIDNLLSNAIKFSPKGSAIVLAADRQASGSIRIQVEDFGPGITEELRHSIFERFEIGTLIKGTMQTGLGLAFCKTAIEAHGGRISVQDNQPQGSIFIIELDGLPWTLN